MPDYLAPGVYIEENIAQVRAIAGAATGTACFLGRAERGVTALTLVTGWGEYQQCFGGALDDRDYLAYAVRGFFENGGRSCAIARIVSRRATHAIAALGDLRVQAVGAGNWGRRVAFKWQRTANDTYSLAVYYWRPTPDPLLDLDTPAHRAAMPQPNYQERFDDLSLDPLSANFVCERVTADTSNLLGITVTVPTPAAPAELFATLGSGGEDGDPIDLEDYTGQSNAGPPHGLKLLEAGEHDAIALVCAPDANATDGLVHALIEHCTGTGKRFAILDTPRGATPDQMIALRNAHPSSYAALYAPWLRVASMAGGTAVAVPPCGHVAGVYARCDELRGVHKAPANEIVRGVVGVEYAISTREQEQLNPQGVNAIRRITHGGLRVWGARTLLAEGEYGYVNVRRLMIFIMESIRSGSAWAIFEPASEPLWSALRRNIEDFLLGLWREGALQGTTVDQAFFVRIGRDTMNAADIEQGRLVVELGLAPVKPAGFIVLRFDLAQQ